METTPYWHLGWLDDDDRALARREIEERIAR